ncbi:hypothetical protein [Terriglobus sp. RCC_193]|uniref:hypothetical protein n=1 Tax=Terriglobus sp. RCC_193 TaxID=3239218 RepID=UPI003523E65A
MRDIAIAYRLYPGVSKIPVVHATDKFQLSQLALESFRRALGGLNFKIWALLDGCPPEYPDLFRRVFTQDELELVDVASAGNLKTFSMQIDLLTQQTEAELVYFAEDDYFYFPDALVEMVNFVQENSDVDFVTPYDHPDSYFTSSRYEHHEVRPFGKRHWRTASSTCLTFLTRRSTLIATEHMMRSYSRGNMDCSLWLALTQKEGLFNPRVHAADTIRLKIWVKTWLWGWRNLLFSRGYKLWSPMPTLSTHLESTGLSPLVDWPEEFAAIEE